MKFIICLSILIFSFICADTLSIIMVGDIMMGTTFPEVRLPLDDGKDIFSNVSEILKNADLTMGNLEGPFTDSKNCTKKIEKGKVYAFRTPPHYAEHLFNAGFDFMNLKNNHINDFGPEGLSSTIDALKKFGIKYGNDETDGEFVIRDKRICIISFSQAQWGNSILDIPRAQNIVAQKARDYDIVVVSFHGGGEGLNFLHTRDTLEYFLEQPRGNVVKFSHAVIDSGADLVWGHGPHVPRAMEIYKERLIVYSAGNFFTYGFNLTGELGYAPIIKVALDSTGTFIQGQIFSAIQNHQTGLILDSLSRAAQLIKKLCLEDFPETSPIINDEGMILVKDKNE